MDYEKTPAEFTDTAKPQASDRQEDSEVALETLRHLARDAVSEEVQLQAASQLLWRDNDPSVPQDLIEEIAEKVATRLQAEA